MPGRPPPIAGLWWRLPLFWLGLPFALLIARINKLLEKEGAD